MDTARDIMIILLSGVGTLLFLVLIVVAVMLFFSIRGLIRDARSLVDDEIKPSLKALRDSANSIKGVASVATGAGVSAAGGNAVKAMTFAMAARRGIGMIRGRKK